jgi:hypothetical protein
LNEFEIGWIKWNGLRAFVLFYIINIEKGKIEFGWTGFKSYIQSIWPMGIILIFENDLSKCGLWTVFSSFKKG